MADVLENTPVQQNVMGSVTADGITVESNFETPEQLREGLGLDQPPVAEAAAPEAEPPQPKRNRREDPRVAVRVATGRQAEAERRATEAAGEATKERERAAKLEAELTQLRQRPAVAPVPSPAPVAAPVPPVSAGSMTQAEWQRYAAMPDAPKPQQFAASETAWNDYQFAVSHFIAEKNFDHKFARMQRQASDAQAHAQFSQRLSEFKARTPDFDRRFDGTTPIDTRLMPLIQRLDVGPEVMLYLSEHKEFAQQLAMLQPDYATDQPSLAQVGKIGEIVGMLKAQSAAAPSPTASARSAPISQAHPPVKRISGAPPAAAVSDAPPGDDASDAEHDAWRAAHPRPSRRRRYR